MTNKERTFKSIWIFKKKFCHVNERVVQMIWEENEILKISKNNGRLNVMYTINYYKELYIRDATRRIWVTTWLTKYSKLNDDKIRIWIQGVVVGFQDKYLSQN